MGWRNLLLRKSRLSWAISKATLKEKMGEFGAPGQFIAREKAAGCFND